MSDDIITQDVLDMVAGESETQAIRDFALGKSQSEFAKAVVMRLEVAVAEAQLLGTGVASYSINGQSVSKSLSDTMRTLAYFKKLAASRSGIIRQYGEFPL